MLYLRGWLLHLHSCWCIRHTHSVLLRLLHLLLLRLLHLLVWRWLHLLLLHHLLRWWLLLHHLHLLLHWRRRLLTKLCKSLVASLRLMRRWLHLLLARKSLLLLRRRLLLLGLATKVGLKRLLLLLRRRSLLLGLTTKVGLKSLLLLLRRRLLLLGRLGLTTKVGLERRLLLLLLRRLLGLATKVGKVLLLLRRWGLLLLTLLRRRLLLLLLAWRRTKVGLKRRLLLLLGRCRLRLSLLLLSASAKGVPAWIDLRSRCRRGLRKSPKQVHWRFLLGRNLRHGRLPVSSLLLSGRTAASTSTTITVPHLVLILAKNPRLEQTLVVVILGHLHALSRRIVLCKIDRIHLFIVGRRHALHFFGGKATVSNSLDTSIQLAMDTRTRHADKGTNGQIDAGGQSRVAIRATLVGRLALQLADQIIWGFLRLATVRMRRTTRRRR